MTAQTESNSTASGQKRRVVGAIVLLALAVIILPMIFDGEGSYQPPVETRIPERPIIELIPEVQQTRPVMSDSAAASLAVAGADAAAPASMAEDSNAAGEPQTSALEAGEDIPNSATALAADARPALAANGLPEGWVVQVGSFQNADNAAALTSRLLAADQRAFERRRRTDNGELVIVLVGPVTTRQAAQSLLSTIAEQEGIEGLVKPFELGSLD